MAERKANASASDHCALAETARVIAIDETSTGLKSRAQHPLSQTSLAQ
jgi:hypothetical protein